MCHGANGFVELQKISNLRHVDSVKGKLVSFKSFERVDALVQSELIPTAKVVNSADQDCLSNWLSQLLF